MKKDSSSQFLVILVLLVTLIVGGAAIEMKRPRKLKLYDVNDLVYIDDFATVDITLAQDEGDLEDFPCHRIDLK